MRYQKTLKDINHSSVIIDESSLYLLIKGNLLSSIWEKLIEISESIEISTETFERLWRKTGTIIYDSKISSEDEKYSSQLELINTLVKQNNVLTPVKDYFKEADVWLKKINVFHPDPKIKEPIALIAHLSDLREKILLVSESLDLKEIVLAIDEQGYAKPRIHFTTTYYFSLAFYYLCDLTIEQFLKFHLKHQNIILSNDRIDQTTKDSLVQSANEEFSKVTDVKPYIFSTDIKKEEVIDLIVPISQLIIDRYKIIGNYRRYDEISRNEILSFIEKIQYDFYSITLKKKLFIIWAPPGSGKTFLIKEIAKYLLKNLEYFFEINLSDFSNVNEFSNQLEEIYLKSKGLNSIILFDEVDTHSLSSWPLERILGFLDRYNTTPIPMIFFAGSSQDNLDTFLRNFSQRPKGKDLLSRIFLNNRFEMPSFSDGDKIILIASKILKFNEINASRLKFIEKSALLYLLCKKEFNDPRQLAECINRSLERLHKTEIRLKFDDLFISGSTEAKHFWLDHKDISGIFNSFITVL